VKEMSLAADGYANFLEFLLLAVRETDRLIGHFFKLDRISWTPSSF